MKTNTTAKFFAAIALFGIIIGIIGTAILFILQGGAQPYAQPEVLSDEEIQKIIEDSGLNIDQTGSGDVVEGAAIDGSVSDEDLQFIESDLEPEIIDDIDSNGTTSQE